MRGGVFLSYSCMCKIEIGGEMGIYVCVAVTFCLYPCYTKYISYV